MDTLISIVDNIVAKAKSSLGFNEGDFDVYVCLRFLQHVQVVITKFDRTQKFFTGSKAQGPWKVDRLFLVPNNPHPGLIQSTIAGFTAASSYVLDHNGGRYPTPAAAAPQAPQAPVVPVARVYIPSRTEGAPQHGAPASRTENTNLCTCPIFDLMNSGCKCGGA